jgi:hypothetical protein
LFIARLNDRTAFFAQNEASHESRVTLSVSEESKRQWLRRERRVNSH